MENPEEYRLNRWLKHKDNATANLKYSISRIDLLIISISGAGIYIIFETLRFINEQSWKADLTLLKVAGCLFAGAILFNFCSQWAGYWTNYYEEQYSELMISDTRNESVNGKDLEKYDNLVRRFGYALRICNILSTVTMFVGMAILILFYLIFF